MLPHTIYKSKIFKALMNSHSFQVSINSL